MEARNERGHDCQAVAPVKLEASEMRFQDSTAAPIVGKRLRRGSKLASVLRTMLERGERGLNCFEAVRLCHDYVLRSSVSDLALNHGIRCMRRWEQVPGHAGSKVECVRYWLGAEDAAKARMILPEELRAAA